MSIFPVAKGLVPTLALTLAACADADPVALEGPFMGADPSVPAAQGEVRAGVVRGGSEGEAALFGGICAEGRAGDIKIYNHLAQFIIQGPYEGHGYVSVGGGVIDADLVRDDDILGRDTLEDVFLAFSMARLFHADQVELLSDGSDGVAELRATGTDVPWEWFQGMFELDEPVVSELGLDISTSYQLEPDSYSLRISTTLSNPGDETLSLSPQDGVWASGEDLLPWVPGDGLAERQDDELAAVVFTGRQGEASFSLWPEEGVYQASIITDMAAEYGIALAEHEGLELAPGQSATLVRYLSVTPDTLTAEAERWQAQGESLGAVQGTVMDGSEGTGIPGVRVHFLQDGQPGAVAGFATTDEEGEYSAQLPAGSWQAYAVAQTDDAEHVARVTGAGRYAPFAAAEVNQAQLDVLAGQAQAQDLAFALGRPSPAAQSIELQAGGSARADFELEPAGWLQVTVRDDLGEPLPAVLELVWAEGAPPDSPVPDELLDALGLPNGHRAAWAWTPDGSLRIPAIPGSYDLTASHDWRHEQQTIEEVELTAGQVNELDFTLETVLQREGWLAMDSHLHGSPSFDGALPMEDRLTACAAAGVDLPVMTDHDVFVDYQPRVLAWGLDQRLKVLPGVEVTTMIRGHFNHFPIQEPNPAAPNGGALRWWIERVSTSELFGMIRALGEDDALLQMNHPRTPGMADFAGYDPTTGQPDDEDLWSWDFDQFELLNAGVTDLYEIRADWFSFLDSGRIVTPLGVSDSHYRFIPCGLGRTDVYLGSDDPGAVSFEALREALLAGHVVVAAGTSLRVTMEADGSEYLPGDVVVADSAELAVRVQAPSWIAPGSLRIYQDGALLHEEALPEESEDGTWFDDSFAVSSDADSWIAVEVEGSEPMGDAWRNATPYAMSNAFLLDVDGDGWEAPGL